MAYKILIPEDIAVEGKDYLWERGYEIKIGSGSSEAAICRDIIDCDAVLVRNARYTKTIMEAGERLRIIARHGTGIDNIDIAAATKLGIQVVNGPAANIKTVAEFAVTLMLALSCQLFQINKETRAGNWDYRKTYTRPEFSENRVGIIGFGNVGQQVAQYLSSSFDPQLLIYDLHNDVRNLTGVNSERICQVKTLEELLETCDIITLHVPSLPTTRGMIGQAQLNRMKNGAYLINCSRGDICDETALYEALRDRQIAGAALDVYAEEPLTNDSPLLTLDNVILSQHCGGLSDGATKRMALYAAQGIHEFFSGKTLSYPINQTSR